MIELSQIKTRLLDKGVKLGSDTPLLDSILDARGVDDPYSYIRLANLAKPAFSNLNNALSLLVNALKKNQRIIVVGDYDADGATATALSVKALRMMGFKQVNFVTPNRFVHGYGISVALVEEISKKHIPDLIICVDHGTGSLEGVACAKAAGVRVIIIDHHLPGKVVPEADALVNAHVPPVFEKGKNLAGVGVAFYLFQSLCSELKRLKYFELFGIPNPNLVQLLDLVALGTMSDVAWLDQNNMILVANGMTLWRSGKGNLGLRVMAEVAGKSSKTLTTDDLSYAIAPMINAAGRLQDINMAVRCLLSDQYYDAHRYAQLLKNLNVQRRERQAQMETDAMAQLKEQTDALQKKEFGSFPICLFKADWHEGIVGSVSGRLAQKFNSPVAIFAESTDGIRGSLRSIDGIDIKLQLDEIFDRCPGIFKAYGGHAMAAGVTLTHDGFPFFKQLFCEGLIAKLKELSSPSITTDGALSEGQISIENAKAISQWCWGRGFETPLFCNTFYVVEQTRLSGKHLRLRLQLKDGCEVYNAVYFNQNLIEAKQVIFIYQLDLNFWRGNSQLQLRCQEFCPIPE